MDKEKKSKSALMMERMKHLDFSNDKKPVEKPVEKDGPVEKDTIEQLASSTHPKTAAQKSEKKPKPKSKPSDTEKVNRLGFLDAGTKRMHCAFHMQPVFEKLVVEVGLMKKIRKKGEALELIITAYVNNLSEQEWKEIKDSL